MPKENYAFEKDIELEYDGKVYIGNTIKYAPRNSNWRLQMKGVADDGSKMTYLTSPRLGIPGGMTEKILVLRRHPFPTDINCIFTKKVCCNNSKKCLKIGLVWVGMDATMVI